MPAVPVLVCVVLAAIVVMYVSFPVEYFSPFTFVGSLIDGKEYNRMEFSVKTAAQCRKVCLSDKRCLAVEYTRDYMGSNSPICVFYDEFSGILSSNRAPSDKTSGVWVK